jgi:hypothetical protein
MLRITKCLRLLATAIFVLNMSSAQKPTAPRTTSLCDLFKDLRSHAGEIVAVRGMLYRSREIYALGSRCENKFVTAYNWAPVLKGLPPLPPTGEFTWATALDLEGSSFAEEGERPVNFQTDEESLRLTNLLIDEGIAKLKLGVGEQPEIWVTVVGQLRLKDHYEIANINGALRGGGYGHLAICPGQLVIKEMRDPRVLVGKK